MFIKYEDIKETDITIDARTLTEYDNMKFFKYNIPIINEKQHKTLKKFPILSVPIVLKGLWDKSSEITYELYDLSDFCEKRIIIGCSQGRLRSPILCLYAKCLGINAKVLKGGIKPFFSKTKYSIKNLYGFLDI